MLTLFFILLGVLFIVATPIALYLGIMGNARESRFGFIISFLSAIVFVTIIPTSLCWLGLSAIDWFINFCRESYQTYLVCGVSIFILLKGVGKFKELIKFYNRKYMPILIGLFYITTGIYLFWYGLSYGYGNLSWDDIIIYFIISTILELINIFKGTTRDLDPRERTRVKRMYGVFIVRPIKRFIKKLFKKKK